MLLLQTNYYLRWYEKKSKYNINFIASRFYTNKILSKKFVEYITRHLLQNHDIGIDLSIAIPQNEKWLQIVDAISRAIFRKYEQSDMLFYNMICHNVTLEDEILT